MIKLLPLHCSRNERQHWLIGILRGMKDENVYLESLRMSESTYYTLINFNQMCELGVNPFYHPCFAGLPIVITCSYSYLQIDFADTFMIPKMPGGSMDDAVYVREPLPKADPPTTEAHTAPSDDLMASDGTQHPPESCVQ